jgi:DNA-binding PadR family transcriptional regulator
MKKKQIMLQIEPEIDKPALYKALTRLHEEEFITFTKIERGNQRGINSEISKKGLLELLNYYSRGPTGSALRTKMLDLISRSPGLRADPEWIVTVQSLMPLVQKLKTRILPSRASDTEISEEYVLSMIWDDPREALRKLIRWIEVTLLMEGSNEQVRPPDEAFQELQTILQKHPIYLKLAREVTKKEIIRYVRMLQIKKAMQKFVATTPF